MTFKWPRERTQLRLTWLRERTQLVSSLSQGACTAGTDMAQKVYTVGIQIIITADTIRIPMAKRAYVCSWDSSGPSERT